MTSVSQTRSLMTAKGSTLGAVLLIAGSCIGVGMLALPVLTAFSGFIPTFAVFVLCWLFMTSTAILLLEANLSYRNQTNIVSLSEITLGPIGRAFAWGTFLFLFYSLLVAYIAKGGELVHQGIEKTFLVTLPKSTGSFLIAFVSGLFVFLGTWILDRFNRICMIGLFLTYFYLLFSGVEHSSSSYITRQDWSYSLFILPFIITSFGFHNMIPSLNEYLDQDRKKMILSIILGGIIPFVVFLLWILKIQSIVPLSGPISLSASYANGEISTEPFAALIKNPWISITAEFFAFFAIITSLLGQSLSVLDFLADGLKVDKTPKGRALLCVITFLPPFLFSQMFPHIFFKALEFAGGIAAMILFGLIPALIVWIGRYKKKVITTPLLPGGRLVLVVIMACSIAVVAYEVVNNLRVFIQ